MTWNVDDAQAQLDRRERLARTASYLASFRARSVPPPEPAPPAAAPAAGKRRLARTLSPPHAAYRYWVLGEGKHAAPAVTKGA